MSTIATIMRIKLFEEFIEEDSEIGKVLLGEPVGMNWKPIEAEEVIKDWWKKNQKDLN